MKDTGSVKGATNAAVVGIGGIAEIEAGIDIITVEVSIDTERKMLNTNTTDRIAISVSRAQKMKQSRGNPIHSIQATLVPVPVRLLRL